MQKNGFSKIIIPSLTVFLSSACIMIIELVASRLIAKHLGSSLYTWTSVIGVVLAGITIGNYVGGRIADKYPSRKALSAIFCLASIACVIIIILNNVVGEWIWLWQLSWPVRVFVHISLVFLLPSMLLGTISPVVAKMALDMGLPAGRTVGDIYACGAAGSIAGTFLAGFYLIAAMGTIAIIWTIAFILLLISVLYRVKSWPIYIWAVILLVFFFLSSAKIAFAEELGTSVALREKPDPTILYMDETPYCYVSVKQISQNPDQRLFLQDKLKHSEVIMGDINNLQYFHTKVFACLTNALSQGKKTLSVFSIGGGGYVLPQYIEKNYPGSRNDVAEIDPGVTKAATIAFGLKDNTSIKSYAMDARNYVDSLLEDKRNGKDIPQYDFIYEDAFSDYNVPFQLVTKEFHDKIDKIIAPNGVYMINMIDVLDMGYFLGAYLNTLSQTFPHVYVIAENAPRAIRTTFSIIASKIPMDVKQQLTECREARFCRFIDPAEIEKLIAKSNGMILTDDFAPVDNLLAPVVRQSAKELLAAKYMTLARKAKAQGHLEESIEYFRIAGENNDSEKILAYNEIGMAYVTLNRPQDAVNAFKVAIDYYYTVESSQKIIASLHLNLGILYQQMKNNPEAQKQYNLAVERFNDEIKEDPTNHTAYSRMGEALATLGKFAEASTAFRKALDLSPGNHYYYGNLIQSLVLQNRIAEAVVLIKEQIALLQKEGDFKSAAELNAYLQELTAKK